MADDKRQTKPQHKPTEQALAEVRSLATHKEGITTALTGEEWSNE